MLGMSAPHSPESGSASTPATAGKGQSFLESLIFASRWVQAPLYLGLIVAGVLYAYKFAEHLWHMIHDVGSLGETEIMLGVLTLVDITMVANLLVMVIIGGYATFVSRLDIDGHPDKPDWLDHIDAGTMKVKLAGSLVGVSGIHLLQTFIAVGQDKTIPVRNDEIMWQVIIHGVFLLSSIMLAWTERVLAARHAQAH
ncbi:MAG: hypothetical protein RIT40_441 [Planctomycetota bacterium]|jgi:uncharacterized protein (TIGR00645 family)